MGNRKIKVGVIDSNIFKVYDASYKNGIGKDGIYRECLLSRYFTLRYQMGIPDSKGDVSVSTKCLETMFEEFDNIVAYNKQFKVDVAHAMCIIDFETLNLNDYYEYTLEDPLDVSDSYALEGNSFYRKLSTIEKKADYNFKEFKLRFHLLYASFGLCEEGIGRCLGTAFNMYNEKSVIDILNNCYPLPKSIETRLETYFNWLYNEYYLDVNGTNIFIDIKEEVGSIIASVATITKPIVDKLQLLLDGKLKIEYDLSHLDYEDPMVFIKQLRQLQYDKVFNPDLDWLNGESFSCLFNKGKYFEMMKPDMSVPVCRELVDYLVSEYNISTEYNMLSGNKKDLVNLVRGMNEKGYFLRINLDWI